ncbi:MAG: twin-arginine translocase subunit TatC [Microbacterium sp.]
MTTATAPASMPLSDHLREARNRAIRAAIALVVGVVAGYMLSAAILDILREPIEALAESRDTSLNYSSITGAFDLKLKIALTAGIVLSSPVWLYEIFAFITPGLHRREKKYVFGFLGAAVPLFALGCATGYSVFPHVVQLLAGFASTEDSTLLSASDYVDFVLKLVLTTGIAYVLPVFIVVLNLLGILSAKALAHSWRWVVVAIVLFSAVVTPSSDVLSMFAVALPMTLLFLIALAIAQLHDRRLAKKG